MNHVQQQIAAHFNNQDYEEACHTNQSTVLIDFYIDTKANELVHNTVYELTDYQSDIDLLPLRLLIELTARHIFSYDLSPCLERQTPEVAWKRFELKPFLSISEPALLAQ
jgi:hypothetical protein